MLNLTDTFRMVSGEECATGEGQELLFNLTSTDKRKLAMHRALSHLRDKLYLQSELAWLLKSTLCLKSGVSVTTSCSQQEHSYQPTL